MARKGVKRTGREHGNIDSPAPVPVVLPMWTKHVIPEDGGRDPLGLSRTADRITDLLLQGIITTTSRARYYSFYCWCLWHIAIEEDPADEKAYQEAFQRREAAFACATLIRDNTASPVGIRKVSGVLAESRLSGLVDTGYSVLPANSLGGFGQYYGGSLYELGLTHRGDDGIDRAAAGSSELLAKSFHTVVQDTPYVKRGLFKTSEIPLEALEKSAERYSLDALRKPFASSERQAVIEVLFGKHRSPPTSNDVFRRQTLTLILDTLCQYEDRGYYPSLSDIDWWVGIPVYYYKVLWPEDKRVYKYHLPEACNTTWSLWQQHCAHQFLSAGLESLLYAILEAIAPDVNGTTVNVAVERIIGQDFLKVLREVTSKPCQSPAALMRAMDLNTIPDERSCLRRQQTISPLDVTSEAKIFDLAWESPAEAAGRSVLMLAALYSRWRSRSGPAVQTVSDLAGADLSIASVLTHIDTWLSSSTRWSTAVAALLDLFIIQQHDRVMYEKGSLSKCWLRNTDGILTKEQHHLPSWRSTRHHNCVTIMRDLEFVEVNDDGAVSVTRTGRKMRAALLGAM